jgi:hypothetical protein
MITTMVSTADKLKLVLLTSIFSLKHLPFYSTLKAFADRIPFQEVICLSLASLTEDVTCVK